MDINSAQVTVWLAITGSEPLRTLPYLDPGSGSILLQLLIAGVLGFLVLLRTSWGRIKSFFGRGPQPEQEEDDEQSDPEG